MGAGLQAPVETAESGLRSGVEQHESASIAAGPTLYAWPASSDELAVTMVPASIRSWHASGCESLRVLDQPSDNAQHPELYFGEVIAEGGMGVVRLAFQAALGREVAVKSLLPGHSGAVATDALLREARVTGALEHPNIVPVHLLGRDSSGAPLLVMKRIEGTSWDDALPTDGSAALARHLGILMQVCRALEFSHSRGIVHRDLKPSNVMLGLYGEVYLVDWGIAVAVRPLIRGVPMVGEVPGVAGTPVYLAPEMLEEGGARISERTDVYLLGGMLHRILTGRAPHVGPGDSAAVLARVRRAEAPNYGPEVPTELAEISRRALKADPAQRFASAAEFRVALEHFVEHRAASALVAQGRARLSQLRGGGAVRSGLRECRFLFELSLRQWPESDDARRGLDEALASMIELELDEGDPRAAAHLFAEMNEPEASLRARVESATSALEQREREAERLKRDLDLRVGQRARAVAAAVCAVLGFLLHGTFGWLDLRHLVRPSHAQHLTICAGYIVLALVVRRWMSANEMSRRLWLGVATSLVVIFLDAVAEAIAQLPVRSAIANSELLVGMSLAMFAVTTDRRFALPAAGFLLAQAVARVFPQFLFFASGTGETTALASLAWIWSRAPAHDASLADAASATSPMRP